MFCWKRYGRLPALIFYLVILSGCFAKIDDKGHPTNAAEIYCEDLDEIRSRGKIIALTRSSSTSYFIYKGVPMGYEYELLHQFADEIGVKLEIKVVEDMDKVFELLNKGEGDIIAANLTITEERSSVVDFCEYHLMARQVLIQRMPDDWMQMPAHGIENRLIRNPIDLKGREIHVRKGTSYYSRLQSLSNEIGGGISIQLVPGDSSTEALIEAVSVGKIDYTIADENIARMNAKYHDNIDVKTAISFPQQIAWAVRKNAPDLKQAIDSWILKNRKTNDYITIYNKYFRSSRAQRERATSDYSSLAGNRISIYDEIIRRQAEVVGWDWRLFASIIYQESKFDPEAESWTGAYGLMQILPETASNFGVDSLHEPEENIRAGALYLARLQSYWQDKLKDPDEIVKFVLASYNVGLGHVIDARRLAEKYGKSPDLWEDNVGYYLTLKSQEKYYSDPVVKHGYCRGSEPFRYVHEVLGRYDHYRNIISV